MTHGPLLLLIAIMLAPMGASAAAAETVLPKGIRVYEPQVTPQFRLSDMDGKHFSLHEAEGRWVFVHFWASWCGPCRREMPSIQNMAERLRDEALEIVLINTSEDEDTVFSFMAVVAPEMISLMDRDGQVTEAWQPRGLPASYLVDPNGRIRYQALGDLPWDAPEYLNFLRSLDD